MAESSLSPMSRSEAKMQGLVRYFTGKPCSSGHIGQRAVVNGSCLECCRVREAQKLDNNPDLRERARVRAAAWYQANRALALRQSAERRAKADRKAVSQYHREYRQKNLARLNAQQSKWVHENMDRVLARTHRRRAREVSAEGFYTAADIAELRVSQKGLCAGKGCSRDISQRRTIDHIIPLCRGGSNWPANLQLLCKSCNSKKGKRTMDEWLAS